MGSAKRRQDLVMAAAKAAPHEKTAPTTKVPRKRAQAPSSGKHRQGGHDDPLKFASQLINVFVNFPLMYEEASKDVDRLDSEYGDLTHAIELADIPRRDAANILKRLKENRKERREAKDFLLLSKGLFDFVKGRQGMNGDLQKLHAEMHKYKDYLTRRTYTPRVMGSMEEAYEKAGIKSKDPVTAFTKD
jgi:hypothetical protein